MSTSKCNTSNQLNNFEQIQKYLNSLFLLPRLKETTARTAATLSNKRDMKETITMISRPPSKKRTATKGQTFMTLNRQFSSKTIREALMDHKSLQRKINKSMYRSNSNNKKLGETIVKEFNLSSNY
jgi:hypothetical protein